VVEVVDVVEVVVDVVDVDVDVDVEVVVVFSTTRRDDIEMRPNLPRTNPTDPKMRLAFKTFFFLPSRRRPITKTEKIRPE
jgi:hypothetical protein